MAAALNSTISWEQLPDNGGQTRAQVHAAFIGKQAEKVLLPAGFAICKMNNYPTLAQNDDPATVVSAWWTAVDRWRNDVGFTDRMQMATVVGVSLREICRIYLAVSEDWNGLGYVARAELREPVYAFYGGVAAQVRIHQGGTSQVKAGEARGATRQLPGRANQLYIPFLTRSHLTDLRMHLTSDLESGRVRVL